MKRQSFITSMAALVTLMCALSCSDDDSRPEPTPEPETATITINPTIQYQKMIGFGGALTWYSERLYNSSKKEEIYQLIFEDLGVDILRLKNWYYPLDYPQNKLPQNMLTTGDENLFVATNEFYEKAKAYNPEVQVLLSSWGPPPALKSNDHLREGTLKQDANGFMYAEFAQYWVDILDNIAFNPEYISIQNEPSYTNPGWTTCLWRANESLTVAGYEEAFDSVYARIKDRVNAPMMIGPESENLSAFTNFAQVVKAKSYCPIYAYHPYNFNESSHMSNVQTMLESMHSNFKDKPNIMTEYSTLSWFKTARFIQHTLRYAHTSAYIYWELVWGGATDQAMIYIDNAGDYTVNPFFYVIKHYAKFIDKGYTRIEVSATQPTMEVTGYLNPAQDQLTLIVINAGSTMSEKFSIEVEGKNLVLAAAFQSKEGSYYNDLSNMSFDGALPFPGSSISTLVFNLL